MKNTIEIIQMPVVMCEEEDGTFCGWLLEYPAIEAANADKSQVIFEIKRKLRNIIALSVK